jgi:hypothetical protein
MWHHLRPAPQFTGLLCGCSHRQNVMTVEWRFVRCLRHCLQCHVHPCRQVTLLVQSLLWHRLHRSPICSFLRCFKTYRRCRWKRLIRPSPSRWGLTRTPPLVCFYIFCAVLPIVEFDIGCVGAHDACCTLGREVLLAKLLIGLTRKFKHCRV